MNRLEKAKANLLEKGIESKIENGTLLLEDGVICSMGEFWLWRRDDSWNDGYSLFEAVDDSTSNNTKNKNNEYSKIKRNSLKISR